MLNRASIVNMAVVACTLSNMSSAWACGMNGTPAPQAQGPQIQVHVGSPQIGRMDMPAVLVQTDVLSGVKTGAQQVECDDSLCLIDGDGLVGYDFERDPEVVRCKAAVEKARRELAGAKQKYRKWLNKLPKELREKLERLEKEDAKNQKDFVQKAVQADRQMTGYFNADDDLREEEKKFNDPNAKGKLTQKELDDMRENVKESKEALEQAKEEAGKAGEKAQKSEKELKETMSKAFSGKEAEYLNDKGEFEQAKENADKADAKLKDAYKEAMKANRT